MNDAFRGGVIVVALVALYLAVRLAVATLPHWRKGRRRHVTHHVFYLTLALLATATLVISGLAGETGEDAPLTWRELLRLAQVAAIVAGLRPLWVHHAHHRETTNG